MARRKERGSTYEPQAMRDRPAIATALRAVRLPSNTLDLRKVEDRRTLPYAIRDEIYRTVTGTPAEISRRPAREAQRKVSGLLPALYHRFETPRRVPVCIRRNDRRRVLFALRKTGKAGRGNRTARWTAKSFVRCK